MTRAVPQHWLLFAGPSDTGLAVKLEPVMSKKGVSLSFTPGQIGESLDIELTTNENDNSPSTDAYRALEDSAQNGGGCGYTLLQSEGHLRNEATFRFQFEKKYLKGDVLHNVSGASADLLFGLAVVTAVRKDLEYRPFAATGILSKDGQVQPIEGLRAKINAALDIPALSGNGLVFYPKANDKDIDVELRHRVEQAQIDLKAVEQLEEAVECLGISIQGTWLGNPYRRLDVFEYSHRRIYFGREDEAYHLAKKLFERAKLGRPNLLILGPSGGGKSSLVQAGLIPELEKRFKDYALSPLFSVFDLRSAANKDVHAIAASIRSSWSILPGLAVLAVNSSSEQQTDSASSDPFAVLVSDLISYLPDQTCFVWVLDQLEQFFTLGLSEEAEAAFIHFLQELQARGIWIVATFRNDFYSALQAHDGILSIFDKDAIHDLEKLSETTIERIIQKPAELARLEFEKNDQKSELLSLKLKNDALGGGKDILPLLEFALDQLYQKRELKNGRTQLTWAAYEAMGGLQGAIGNRADEVLQSLDESAQEALGHVLRTLAKLRRDSVQTESGKSPFIASVVNVEQFTSGTPARRLVDAFADARLFVLDRDNEGIAQVRVTHEALFTHWAKADKILKDSMKDMVVRERLADSEVHWKAKDEAVSLLLQSGLPLEEAQDLLARLGDELDPDIIHYIKQSSSAAQERKQKESEAQRRKTRLAIITAVVLGILLFVATGAVYYVNQARKEQATMLASSYFSEGARLVDEGRSNEALAYLAKSISIDSKTDTGATRLTASLLFSPKELINISTVRIPCHYEMKTAQFSPDGRWILAVCGNIVYVWDAVSGKSIFPPMIHKRFVELAQFSFDGRLVVTVSDDHIAQIWETAEGTPISLPMRHNDFLRSVQFSPDGHRLITASQYEMSWVWDVATGTLLKHSAQFDDNADKAQFSPDGHLVIIGTKDGKARVWNTNTGVPVSQPMQHDYRVSSAQFSPDGSRIVIAAGNRVRVWDITTGLPVSQQMIHKDGVRSAQFSPDGRLVITISNFYRTVQTWEVATGAIVSQPMQHEGVVNSAQFSPDGRWVVTASMDGAARVWDVETGELVSQPMRHNKYVNTAQFSPDGRRILTASDDGTAKIWEVKAGNPLYSLMGGNIGLTEYSPDGQWVITTSGYIPRIWKARNGTLISQLVQQKGNVRLARFSPDNHWVATASVNNSSDEKINTTVQIWETATGVPVTQPIEQEAVLINSIQFSPDGRRIVIATSNKIAQVWDVGTGMIVSQLHHGSVVSSAQFSSDGRRILTSSWDNTSLIWDASTGTRLSQPMQHKNSIHSAQFSPDDRWVMTVSKDKTVRVWEAATGTPLSQPIHHVGGVKSAQFSPDGRWVVTVSGNRTIQVWEATTGKPVSSPMEHKDEINSAYFSLDGRWVITSSDDRTARVWEAATGKPVSSEIKHQGSVISAQFSPDGRWVVTSSRDKTVRIWDAITGKPISVLLQPQPKLNLSVAQAKFSPDSLRVMTSNAHVWEIPSISQKVGKGYTEFLERISGYAVNDNNVLQEKYKESTTSELRAWVENINNITPEERSFINWWLSDPIERTVTPNSKQTVKERVQMLIDRDTIASLNEALDYYPGHPMALARLAAATWRETKTDQQADIRPRVALWANLALKYAPDDAAVRAVAEKVLQDIAQPN